MEIKELVHKITTDLAVELADEFDRNFERKGFFTEKWSSPKINNSRGSVLNRTGNLRRSIRYNVSDNSISFSSSLPYASIHNEGGEIVVTAQMKKFFWAMFYKSTGAEAMKWKGMALMKIGQKMKIEKRQFIGDHPEVARAVRIVVNENMTLFNEQILKQFNR